MDKLKVMSLSPKKTSPKISELHLTSVERTWTSNVNIWHPPSDLYENSQVFVIQIEIAGMKDGEFTISQENNIITIHGIRTGSKERRAYHQMEIPHGEFISTLQIPSPIMYENIEAFYDDGFLKIVLPKK